MWLFYVHPACSVSVRQGTLHVYNLLHTIPASCAQVLVFMSHPHSRPLHRRSLIPLVQLLLPKHEFVQCMAGNDAS
jgi:hypothetical protein